MTEYEKQRLLRIRENKARLEALGLPGLVSSFHSDLSKSASTSTAPNKRKKKKTEADEEEEYQPSDEDDEEEEPMENRSSEEEMPCTSSSRKKKCHCCKIYLLNTPQLIQAIALSLGESVENKNGEAEIQNKAGRIRMSNSNSKEESVCKKINKKPNKSRIQLNEDEVIAFFFSFDEVGKGYITAYDIEKMAIAHDFTWTDDEISKMVRSFDSDGDRKLSLEDFRSIVSKCHMLQESE
ncbi:EF-hand domain pair [Carex littledalei]|uniref:EF-hand domain pair n=1 Tax=Carex littledalei TaxID=544730 RepID=A0A833V1A1_9POAL|nr:EF-hand domain pair [Carex littledalei]